MLKVETTQVAPGKWEKRVEGRRWANEKELEEDNKVIDRCPKCEGACVVVDDEKFEEASGWELEKFKCEKCGTMFEVDATSYRGSIGIEFWKEVEDTIAG